MQDYSCLDTLTACCSPEREHRCFWASHGGVSGLGTGTSLFLGIAWWRNRPRNGNIALSWHRMVAFLVLEREHCTLMASHGGATHHISRHHAVFLGSMFPHRAKLRHHHSQNNGNVPISPKYAPPNMHILSLCSHLFKHSITYLKAFNWTFLTTQKLFSKKQKLLLALLVHLW